MGEPLKEALRAWFRAQELGEDPRHLYGRGRWGVQRRFEGGRQGPPGVQGKSGAAEFTLVPPLLPPLAALEGRCADHLWVLTSFLLPAWQDARRGGLEGVLLTFELADCQYSARLEQTLIAGRAHWAERFGLLRFCLGSRMEKRWLRQLALGEDGLRLASLPMVLVMETVAEGLRFKSLALSPLGPGQDQPALRALLLGTPQLAPGTQTERVWVLRGSEMRELSSQNGFSIPWTVSLVP